MAEIKRFGILKKEILDLISEVDKEILVELDCNFQNTNAITSFIDNLLNKLVEIKKNKSEIKVMILISIRDWMITKIGTSFIHLVQAIDPQKFEVKCPHDKVLPNFRIFLDSQLFQFIIAEEFTGTQGVLMIKDKFIIEQGKAEFKFIFQNSVDFRDAITEYEINNDLERALLLSYERFSPVYNFNDTYIEITGFRKVLKIILYLYRSAKEEIMTIAGPLYQRGLDTKSIMKILDHEKFYDKLNEIIENKFREKLKVLWVRNITEPHLTLYDNDTTKKKFIDLILSMYPYVKMKQIDFKQQQFSIIDRKILCILEYFPQFKIIIVTNNAIIMNYYFSFQKIWSEAIDIRYQWTTEVSDNLKKYIEGTFKDIPVL